MRIRLTFEAVREAGATLPVDYQHLLSGLIYTTIRSAARDFAARLHDVGYDSNGRRFKLFTFSRLKTKATLRGEQLVLQDRKIELLIGSPIAELISHFERGLAGTDRVLIGAEWFLTRSVEHLPAPPFKEKMHFRALSPITLSDKKDGEPDRYLSLSDNWSELIKTNLIGKYKALNGCEPADQRLWWRWDAEYIADAEQRRKRLSVLKKIHGIDIRGWLAPFTVEGSTSLIEMGYEAGFGARNSMGFGMAEACGASEPR
jgi:CRISPR-associated endoribonuclease Cas6